MSRAIARPKPSRLARGRRRARESPKPMPVAHDDNSLDANDAAKAVIPPRPRRSKVQAEVVNDPSGGNSSGGARTLPQPVVSAPRRRSASTHSRPEEKTPTGHSSADATTQPTPGLHARPRRRATWRPIAKSDARDGNSQGDHLFGDTRVGTVAHDAGEGAKDRAHGQNLPAPPLASAFARLGIFAAAVDDIERTRIALSNRAGAFVRNGASEDSEDVVAMRALSDAIETSERIAIKRMESCLLKEIPLGKWVKAVNGLGLKTVARFLACVGNPRVRLHWTEPDEQGIRKVSGWSQRTVGMLWAYCGLDVRDGKAPKRARGEKGNWNAVARKRAYCMAEPCIKNTASLYRPVYDAARAKYAETEISDLHKHKRAMRAVMKAIVKDLWIHSGGDQRSHEVHRTSESPRVESTGGA